MLLKRFGDTNKNVSVKSNFNLGENIIKLSTEGKNPKQIHSEIADTLSSFGVFLLENFDKNEIESKIIDVLAQIKKLEMYYGSNIEQLDTLALGKLAEEGLKNGENNG